jgi:hypothetical protein
MLGASPSSGVSANGSGIELAPIRTTGGAPTTLAHERQYGQRQGQDQFSYPADAFTPPRPAPAPPPQPLSSSPVTLQPQYLPEQVPAEQHVHHRMKRPDQDEIKRSACACVIM